MDYADHVALLRDGVPHERGTWADLGAGDGAFTLALADLLPEGSTIHAIDRDRSALEEEPRVLHVMVSRARYGLVLTRAATTNTRIGPPQAEDSRWLERLETVATVRV